MLRAQKPTAAFPAGTARRRLQRQDIAGDFVEALVKNSGKPLALLLVLQPGLEGVDVDWQAAFAPHVIPGILISRDDVFRLDAEHAGQFGDEFNRLPFTVAVGVVWRGEERIVAPDRFAVLAPVAGEGPARQGFAGIPFALAVVEQAALGKFRFNRRINVSDKRAFFRPERGEIPFLSIHVVDGHERRLTSHCQANVVLGQFDINPVAQIVDLRPLLLGIGFGDAGDS